MTLEEAKKRLNECGHTIDTESRLPNNTGVQLRLDGGSIVNVFDNGTVQCQGKNAVGMDAQLKGKVPKPLSKSWKVTQAKWGFPSCWQRLMTRVIEPTMLMKRPFVPGRTSFLELGILIAKLGRKKVAILLKQSVPV